MSDEQNKENVPVAMSALPTATLQAVVDYLVNTQPYAQVNALVQKIVADTKPVTINPPPPAPGALDPAPKKKLKKV